MQLCYIIGRRIIIFDAPFSIYFVHGIHAILDKYVFGQSISRIGRPKTITVTLTLALPNHTHYIPLHTLYNTNPNPNPPNAYNLYPNHSQNPRA
jgi:hypothetical protein